MGFLRENYVTLIMIVGVFVCYFSYDIKFKKEEKVVLLIAFEVGVLSIIRYAEGYFATIEQAIIPRSIMCSLGYIMLPFLALQYLFVTAPKKTRFWLAIPEMILVVLCVMDMFGMGLTYRISAGNHWVGNCPLRFMPFLVGIIYLVFIIVFSMIHFERSDFRNRIVFVYIVAALATAVLLESAYQVYALNTLIVFSVMLFGTFLVILGKVDVENEYLKEKNKLLESEKALAESRIELLTKQINRHFIYNCLVAMKSLCRRDPKKAEEYVQKFSVYLRNKLESMTSEKIIPFENEVENIKLYLNIEFTDPMADFEVEWNLKVTDFMLPALSIEPLVENAVQHGIVTAPGRGVIKISSYEDEKRYYVTVEDNGTGSDNDIANQRAGVGVNNIRTRLELTGGELKMKSDSFGTEVTVIISKGI